MRLKPHLAASAAAGGVVWAVTGEPVALPIAIAAGVLPDVDHLFDYYFMYVRRDRRFHFYLLHSWEYLIAGVIAYIFFVSEPWLLAILAGYATQLILDQAVHGGTEWLSSYFLTPRILTGFKAHARYQYPNKGEYQSFVKSLPFGRDAAERWFERRLGPKKLDP